MNFVGNLDQYFKPLNELNPYLYTGNNPIDRIDPSGLLYFDLNFGWGSEWFIGFSFGLLFGSEGIHMYFGPGIMNPGWSGAFTWSKDEDVTPRCNIGVQLTAVPSYQIGTVTCPH